MSVRGQYLSITLVDRCIGQTLQKPAVQKAAVRPAW